MGANETTISGTISKLSDRRSRVTIARFLEACAAGIIIVSLPVTLSDSMARPTLVDQTSQLSILLFSFSAALVVFQPLVAKLEYHWGSTKDITIVGLILYCICTALITQTSTFTSLLLLRTLQGAFVASLIPGSISILLSDDSSQSSGKALGIMESAKAIGFCIGPVIGGAITSAFSVHTAYIVASMLLALATTSIAGISNQTSKTKHLSKPQVLWNLELSLLFLGAFLASGSAVSFLVLYAGFEQKISQTYLGFSLAFSAMMFGRLIFSPLCGKLNDYCNPHLVLLSGVVLLAVSNFGLAASSTSTQVVALRVLAGLGMAMFYTAAMMKAAYYSNQNCVSTYRVANVSAGFSLGAALGPIITASLIYVLPIEDALLVWGGTGLVFATVYCWVNIFDWELCPRALKMFLGIAEYNERQICHLPKKTL